MKTSESAVKKVIIAEDETSIRTICQRVLSSEGYEVDLAANGKAAQDMIIKNKYDLCLIDIRLPLMNGMELYRWLKLENIELMPVMIFTTGDVMREDIRGFLEQAGRHFLPKPFTPDELIAMVKELSKPGE